MNLFSKLIPKQQRKNIQMPITEAPKSENVSVKPEIQARLAGTGYQFKPMHRVSSLFKKPGEGSGPNLGRRYAEFCQRGAPLGLFEKEYLLPLLEIPYAPSMAERRAQSADWDEKAAALLAVHAPGTWGYYLALSSVWSTLGRIANIVGANELSRFRSEHRLSFIWGGLEAICGGKLAGKSVLDIACNWGAFAIEGALRGCGPVTAFDIREGNLQKARAAAQHFEVPDIEFLRQDIFEYPETRQFDIVLNLGLMYHISKPFEMMKKTFNLTKEIAVIDTVAHLEPFSGFILGTGEAATQHAATAIGVELHPTYRSLIDLAYMVGFRDVVEVEGLPRPEWRDFNKDIYGVGTRRCIVAFK